MKVDLQIKFSEEDLEQMLLERAAKMKPAVEGRFEAEIQTRYGIPEGVVKFVEVKAPETEGEPQPVAAVEDDF